MENNKEICFGDYFYFKTFKEIDNTINQIIEKINNFNIKNYNDLKSKIDSFFTWQEKIKSKTDEKKNFYDSYLELIKNDYNSLNESNKEINELNNKLTEKYYDLINFDYSPKNNSFELLEIDYDPPNNDINNNSSKYDKEITRNSLESYSNNDNISHNDNNSNSENENDIVNSNNTTKEKEEFKTLFLNSIENLIN